jgi:hypothetical protein
MTPRRTFRPIAGLTPQHGVAQCPGELSEGIAPPTGLQNRACRRVGGQRVTSSALFQPPPSELTVSLSISVSSPVVMN